MPNTDDNARVVLSISETVVKTPLRTNELSDHKRTLEEVDHE